MVMLSIQKHEYTGSQKDYLIRNTRNLHTVCFHHLSGQYAYHAPMYEKVGIKLPRNYLNSINLPHTCTLHGTATISTKKCGRYVLSKLQRHFSFKCLETTVTATHLRPMAMIHRVH